MKHHASSSFWESYESLPVHVQRVADANYELLKQNPKYPSLHFKRIGKYWSVRVGIEYRALGIATKEGDVIWFWIGSHAQYDQLIGA